MTATTTGTLRIGVIGVGRIGRMHASLIARQIPGASVAAVHDSNDESARDVALSLGVPTATDVDELLSNPLIEAYDIEELAAASSITGSSMGTAGPSVAVAGAR